LRTSWIICAILGLLAASSVLGADGDQDARPKAPAPKPAEPLAPELDPAREADALAFVRDQHPELATVLEALKPMNPAEYRKAIAELSEVARSMAEVKRKNPRRHEVILASWRAKSRVELLAAQLAGSPTEELRSQLRTAIETRIDAEIARRRFDLEQAEAAAKKAREALDLLENHRETAVESRFRALQPKKLAKAKKPASTTKPAKPLAPTRPPGENR
jgi:hypothetical protein